MKLHLAIVPILAVLVAAYVLFPRATPRVIPNGPAGSGTPASATSVSLGAPSEGSGLKLEVPDAAQLVPSPTTAGGAPKPSGGIDKGFYCSEPTCGYVEPTAKPTPISRGLAIAGTATYYCRPGISRCTVGYPFGMYAAAGPEVRAMLGPDWRGRTVVVIDANGRGVLVQLIDWCACGGDHVIDLYWTAYQGLVNPVTVREQP